MFENQTYIQNSDQHSCYFLALYNIEEMQLSYQAYLKKVFV